MNRPRQGSCRQTIASIRTTSLLTRHHGTQTVLARPLASADTPPPHVSACPSAAKQAQVEDPLADRRKRRGMLLTDGNAVRLQPFVRHE